MNIADGLSIVIPCYNEGDNLEITLQKIIDSHQNVEYPIEIVVSDDGSTDGYVLNLKDRVESTIIKFVLNEHLGRIEARFRGILETTYPNVMVLDARIRIRKNTLANLEMLCSTYPESIFWNGLVKVQDNGNPLVSIWQTLELIGWGSYTLNPVTTHYGNNNFDKFPKGTSFFVTTRKLWLSGFKKLREYTHIQNAAISDDTRIIRNFAAISDIWISPELEVDYQPRTSWKKFLKNGFYRGGTFVDSYWDSNGFFGKAVKVIPIIVILTFISGCLFAPVQSVYYFSTFLVTVISIFFLRFSFKKKRKIILSLQELLVLIPFFCFFSAGFTRSYFLGLTKRVAASRLNRSK